MRNGLLHHLDDEAAVGLLRMCGATSTVERIVTNDTVYLSRAGLNIVEQELVRSHPTRGIARYLVMVLGR